MADISLACLRTALDAATQLSYCDGSLDDVYQKEPSFAKLFYQVGPDQAGFVDFSESPSEESLKALADACHKATFGLKEKNVLNEDYRKAGKMDNTQFSTLLCPKSLGIIDLIAGDLNQGKTTAAEIETQLYKLNVYGPGSFFKPHIDTPQGENFIGTLVLVLPTKHEGGALAFNHAGHQWAFDSAKTLSGKQSLAYVAFVGDMQHEVLPVASGYRVTITYNLFEQKNTAASAPPKIAPLCDYPGLVDMRKSLTELLNAQDFLPDGGIIGFALSHRYPFNKETKLRSLYERLRGPDALLKGLCKELGIDVSLKALYHYDKEPDFCLVDKFVFPGGLDSDINSDPLPEQLIRMYNAIYCRDPYNKRWSYYSDGDDDFTPLVWVKELSNTNKIDTINSMDTTNEPSWINLYGEVCLVARVAPASERLPDSLKRARSESIGGSDKLAKKSKRESSPDLSDDSDDASISE